MTFDGFTPTSEDSHPDTLPETGQIPAQPWYGPEVRSLLAALTSEKLFQLRGSPFPPLRPYPLQLAGTTGSSSEPALTP